MKNPSDLQNPATLHAFFLAAKEKGYNEFQVQLVANQSGRLEIYIRPRGGLETTKFEIRGNMVRVALAASGVPLINDAALINYGGTRSGEQPVAAE